MTSHQTSPIKKLRKFYDFSMQVAGKEIDEELEKKREKLLAPLDRYKISKIRRKRAHYPKLFVPNTGSIRSAENPENQEVCMDQTISYNFGSIAVHKKRPIP